MCTWDCGYYREIGTKGYSLFVPKAQTNLAFYPGFPLVTSMVMKIFGGSFGWSGILLNFMAYALTIMIAMRWTWELGVKEYFWLPMLLWASDRFTLWSHVPYTESLFMLFGLGLLLLLRQDSLREKKYIEWLALPFLAGALSGMRLVGMAGIASWGWGEIKSFLKNPVKGAFALLLGLWGFLAFCFYLYHTQGDALISFQATSAWGRYFDLMGFFRNMFYLLKHFYFPTVPVLFITAYVLIKPPKALSFRPTERWFFGFLLLLPLLNSIPLSTTRYFSVLFPAYVFVGWKAANVISVKRWVPVALVLFVGSELLWQGFLTVKYMRFEALNWLN